MSRHATRLTRTLPLTTFTVALALALLTPTPTPAQAAAPPPATYYVDCRAGNDNNAGTDPAHPLRTLAKASARTYRPGERILFERGTTCTGTFAPKGSGTPGAPIAAGAYGTGTGTAKPHIEGNGARAAVLLDNVQQWELHDLDVSNTGPATTTARRAGILVRLTDFGTGHHYAVRDVDVHDVNGADFKDPDPSGGILFAAQGTVIPTGFDDVTVSGSTVNHVDRTGIGTSSTWGRRPEHPQGPGTTFVPITGLRIENNRVADTGGDGIVIQNADGALAEHNTVDGFNARSAGYNAGLWAWNSDHVRYQYNEVSHGHGTRDSMAFDIDGGNNGNVYQYNYSHDNEGGFLLVCNGGGMTSADNVVRHNISVNDRNRSAPYGIVSVVCGASTRTQVYDNTVVTNQSGTAMVSDNGPGNVTFRNNVFVSSAPGGAPFADPRNTYDHNLYRGVGAAPASDRSPVTADPAFTAPVPAGPYDVQLRSGSPALRAGVPIADGVTRDWFGNAVASPPNIGAYQGPGAAPGHPGHSDQPSHSASYGYGTGLRAS
ncbi:right-handed parallel beta-helix repeat-containing protein [Streptomyces sp. NPDC002506]|uniref:right-handed parallel beta-helix repeat-containing protein n=1 Tax=Streptomyces sp. NPDC002506 TaxID=3154536 RepID=UPI0033216410